MLPFSERYGHVKKVLQIDNVSDGLRNRLWNAIMNCYITELPFDNDYNIPLECKESGFLQALCDEFLKCSLDNLLYDDGWHYVSVRDLLKDHFCACKWYKVYDFIQFFANRFPNTRKNQRFIAACDTILEQEVAVYRFVDGEIAPIQSAQEIAEIEKALATKEPFELVSKHLKSALDLLSKRPSPDYRNSIKESISAVEAICKIIAKKPKTELAGALKALRNSGKVAIHRALEKGFIELYAYTSDADGIRHALMDKERLDLEDAQFMLVACSAFTNYLVAKAQKAEVDLL